MDAAVVYESMFGNTREVAEAIAAGIREADPSARVTVARAGTAKLSAIAEAGLLVVGGPTAAFDTRLENPMAGGAARSVARQLHKHGYPLAAAAEGFIVTGAEGPLRDGEIERARHWGAALARPVDVPGRG